MKFINNLKESKTKTVAISLVVIGVLILFGVAIFGGNKELNLEMETTILAFAETDATNKEIRQLKKDLKALENVLEIEHKSKEDSLEEIKNTNDVLNRLVSELPDNPLSDYFIVTIKDAEMISVTANEIRRLDGVASASFSKELQDKYADFIQGIT